MRKTIIILTIIIIAHACKNKDLYIGIPANKQKVDVVINWAEGQYKPAEGMRVNIFSLNAKASYGIEDMSSDGGSVNLEVGSKVATLCYSYLGNAIYFRNESNFGLIEAYASPTTRATYTRAYPDEITYAEPPKYFYIGLNPSFDILRSDTTQVINLSTVNVIKTYTFEVRNVKGISNITATRGAISGMSNSIFLSSRQLSPSTTTLLFNATANVLVNKIEGSFQTFGRFQDPVNVFTIEILYPSTTGGLIQRSWDVTNQTSIPGNYHIIIEDSEIDVPEGGGPDSGDSGFLVGIGDWNSETIELN